jgi:hypothetical protein
MEQIADKEIIKSEDIDLTVRQELRMLECVKRHLADARIELGPKTRFWELAYLIDQAVIKAASEAVAADDYLSERM